MEIRLLLVRFWLILQLRRHGSSLRCRHISSARSFLLTSRTSLRRSGTGSARAAAGTYLCARIHVHAKLVC